MLTIWIEQLSCLGFGILLLVALLCVTNWIDKLCSRHEKTEGNGS